MTQPDVLTQTSQDDAVARLEISGLSGRGGAWFPAARKWRAVRVEGGLPVVVANGAEGEPGSIKDRWLMLTRPGEVVAGVVAACRALGSAEAIVYVKGSFRRGAERLRAAAAAAPSDIAIRVHEGEDGYIVGEETALLESLEGRKAWPRPKPPLPCAVGLAGRPTLVQNVETLLRVPAALLDPEGYRRSETTFVSLWGQVRKPGVYEVPLGTPLSRVIDDYGGGGLGTIGLVFPAGPSAAPLTAAQLDTLMAPQALRDAGSGLGTAAILVVEASTCPLRVAASLAAFFEREACGQCPPCVVGTGRLSEILRRLEAGQARGRDLASLGEAAGFMSGHGYCAHGRTAAAAVTGLLGRVPDDVRAHLEAGCCPRPGPPADPFGAGSPERAAIEAVLEAVP